MEQEAAPPKRNMPKRHHTVPEFYLRRFATNENVELVRRDDFSVKLSTHVDNATVEKHFYTLDIDGERSPELEDFFANIVEPMGANSISRIVDQGFFPPPPGRRNALSAFCAMQFIRGAAARQVLRDDYEAVAKSINSMMTREQAREVLTDDETPEPSDAEVDDLIAWAKDGSNYSVRASNEANHFVLAALKSATELVPFFEQRKWILLTFESDALVTSDEPIALASRSGEPGEESLGLATAEQIFLVIDPRHAIAMIRPDLRNGDGRHRGDADLAALINRNVAYGAHRWIVQRPGTEPLRGLSVPRKGPGVVTAGDLITMQLRPRRA